jgi:hypothetical protein
MESIVTLCSGLQASPLGSIATGNVLHHVGTEKAVNQVVISGVIRCTKYCLPIQVSLRLNQGGAVEVP